MLDSLALGLANIVTSWEKKPRKKIKHKKIELNEILGRDVSDINSGWRADAKNLKKDWDKVLKK